MTPQRRMRAISWLAIFAVLASVLAPAASRAMVAWSGGTSPWDEICTSLGLTKIASRAVDQGSESGAPAAPAGSSVPIDCPYCVPSATPAALPSQPTGAPKAVEQETSRLLFFFISAAHPVLVPDPFRPRGPPTLS